MSRNQFARLMGVGPRRVHDIVRARLRVTGDTAVRMARVTGMSAEEVLGSPPAAAP